MQVWEYRGIQDTRAWNESNRPDFFLNDLSTLISDVDGRNGNQADICNMLLRIHMYKGSNTVLNMYCRVVVIQSKRSIVYYNYNNGNTPDPGIGVPFDYVFDNRLLHYQPREFIRENIDILYDNTFFMDNVTVREHLVEIPLSDHRVYFGKANERPVYNGRQLLYWFGNSQQHNVETAFISGGNTTAPYLNWQCEFNFKK